MRTEETAHQVRQITRGYIVRARAGEDRLLGTLLLDSPGLQVFIPTWFGVKAAKVAADRFLRSVEKTEEWGEVRVWVCPNLLLYAATPKEGDVFWGFSPVGFLSRNA